MSRRLARAAWTLTGMGYDVRAVNGRGGLDWLAGHPAPSLILLDLMMPEMDGFEFLASCATACLL